MKKLLALLLALMMLFSAATVFAGCEDSGKKKSSSSKNNDEDEDENDDNGEEDDKKNDEESNEDNGNVNSDEEDDLTAAEQAMQDFIDACYYGSAKLEKIAPQDFWVAKGYDSLDEIRELLPEAVTAHMQETAPEYGKDLQLSIEITAHKTVDEEQLRTCAEALADNQGIDADKVEKGLEITAILKVVSSSANPMETENVVSVICYDGSWYPVLNYDLFMADYAIFVMENYMENTENQGNNSGTAAPDLHPAAQALQDYVDVYYYGDASKLEASAPQEFWDTVSSDYSLRDLKAVMPDYIAEMEKMVEEEYGSKSYAVSVVVTGQIDMDYETLDEYVDALEDDYGIDPNLVEGGCILTYDMTVNIAGNTDSTSDNEMYMICYNGAWYPIEADSYEDVFHCDFFVSSLIWTLEYYME